MVFLVIVAVIGLVAIAAGLIAVNRDGYGASPTRDSAFSRATFDHAGFHARSRTEFAEIATSAEEPIA